MRIDFQRSAGVSGMTSAATLDTDTLPPEEAHELEQLVERCGFFAMPASGGSGTAGPDEFTYSITIESEGRRHTVRTSDSTAPPALIPLLDRLARLARRGGRR